MTMNIPGALAFVLLLLLPVVVADSVSGSSSAWTVTGGDKVVNPIDDCNPVEQGLFLVQPAVAELTFQGTAATVQGGGGIAMFSLDGEQNITSMDTGSSQCVQLAQWTGLDPASDHVLRVEALEAVRAVAIAQVSIDGGAASTSSTTTGPISSTKSPSTSPTTSASSTDSPTVPSTPSPSTSDTFGLTSTSAESSPTPPSPPPGSALSKSTVSMRRVLVLVTITALLVIV